MTVNTATHKRCTNCGRWLERDTAFPGNIMTRDGLSSWCRECHAAANRAYRARRRAQMQGS